jgi:hypothetical protein
MEIELLQIQCYQKADDLVCFMEGEQIKVNCKCALRLLASEQGDGYMKLQKQVKESRNQGYARQHQISQQFTATYLLVRSKSPYRPCCKYIPLVALAKKVGDFFLS